MARIVENIGVFEGGACEPISGGQQHPRPALRWRQAPTQFRAAADAPDTPDREGKSSQREYPCGRHQTIILPCVGANLSNGHKGTRVSSGYAARGGDRGKVSQVHGSNQAPSSEVFALQAQRRGAAFDHLDCLLSLLFPATWPYSCPMPSFDIVSQVNSMEIENAVNQAKKELANRFDFKGSKAEIILEKNEIKLSAEDQFKIKALDEIVISKLAKRQISLKNIERAEPDISPLGHARQAIKIKQGIDAPVAKQITAFIRDTKLKVTTQILGDQVRVTGKSKDDLQGIISALRARDFPVALNFQNFRD